jgi:uncharacterized protein YndB with AHSA1/START domain
MDRSITLATDVNADPNRVFEILTSTEGQRGFWTADCEVTGDQARFVFPGVPIGLRAALTTEPGKLVRMRVTTGFPYWEDSTWEWELGPATRTESGTSVLFRHYGFAAGYSEVELGHTAQTWALILDRLAAYATTGVAHPFFPATAA